MKIYISMLLFFMCLYFETHAQQTLYLDDLEYHNSIHKTFPTRSIEYTDDGIIVTYLFDKINIYPDYDFIESKMVHIDGFGDNEIEEEPLIPIRYDSYGNLSGRYKSIIMVDSSYIDVPLELSPSRKPQIEIKDSLILDLTKPIKSYEGYFPTNTISLNTLSLIKNRQSIKLKISPILYNYRNKTARIYKKISFKINIEVDDNIPYFSSPCINQYLNNIFENQVTNFTRTNNVEVLNNDFLIITTSSLLPAVSLYAKWKKILGYNTIVENRDVWNTDSIKTIIESYYNPDHFQYLLFVGDENHIPPSGYEEYEHRLYFPYDLDYLKFNNINHSLDIISGRLPVSNLEEARIIFKKIINYESSPTSNTSFYDNAMFSSYFQNDIFNPGYASQNFVETLEEVRTYLINKDKTIHRVYFTEDDVDPQYYCYGHPVPNELRKPGFLWDGDSADIKNIIDQGAFLAIHRDHGWETRWVQPKFDIYDINSLENGNLLPVVFSLACQTGEYDYIDDESFVEAFMKHNNGGCVGIIAASGVTYTNSNNSFLKALIDVIWPNPGIINNNIYDGRTPVYRLGEILYQGLARAITSQNWNEKMYHCFGDPSMRIYTSKPTGFENMTISRNNNNIYVNTNDDDTEIAFYDKFDECVYLYKGRDITQSCNPQYTTVCISAPNRITHIDIPHEIVYLQNLTITGNRSYSSSNVICGTNVDLNQPFGNVVFGGGNIELINSDIEFNGQTIIEGNTSITVNNTY